MGCFVRETREATKKTQSDCVFRSKTSLLQTHTKKNTMPSLEAIRWAAGRPARLELLDQRLLPGQMVYIDVPDAAAAWTAIKVSGVG
jgi:hypothetical protein